MDIQTLWNRLDELEKFVRAQSREVDMLKEIIYKNNNNNIYGDNRLNVDPIFTNNMGIDKNPNSNRQTIDQDYRTNAYLSAPMIINKSQTSKVDCHEARNSFANMSSYIHPSIAVPPTINWTKPSNTDTRTGRNERDTGLIANISDGFDTNCSSSSVNNSRNSCLTDVNITGPPRNSSRLFSSSDVQQQLRYSLSTRPFSSLTSNSLQTNNINNKRATHDFNFDSDESPFPKEDNQGLAEVLTCFCPCFNMC